MVELYNVASYLRSSSHVNTGIVVLLLCHIERLRWNKILLLIFINSFVLFIIKNIWVLFLSVWGRIWSVNEKNLKTSNQSDGTGFEEHGSARTRGLLWNLLPLLTHPRPTDSPWMTCCWITVCNWDSPPVCVSVAVRFCHTSSGRKKGACRVLKVGVECLARFLFAYCSIEYFHVLQVRLQPAACLGETTSLSHLVTKTLTHLFL